MTKNKEIWKDIKGYEGAYQISNWGRVKSLSQKQELIRKPHLNKKKGYVGINLFKDGKRVFHLIHRLVAKQFIPNPNNYPEVNHIDEIKHNNFDWNLEWCSCEYNVNYGEGIAKRAELRKIEISQFDLDGRFIRNYNGGVDAEVDGYSRKAISKCLTGVNKTHKGYIWRYADD